MHALYCNSTLDHALGTVICPQLLCMPTAPNCYRGSRLARLAKRVSADDIRIDLVQRILQDGARASICSATLTGSLRLIPPTFPNVSASKRKKELLSWTCPHRVQKARTRHWTGLRQVAGFWYSTPGRRKRCRTKRRHDVARR